MYKYKYLKYKKKYLEKKKYFLNQIGGSFNTISLKDEKYEDNEGRHNEGITFIKYRELNYFIKRFKKTLWNDKDAKEQFYMGKQLSRLKDKYKYYLTFYDLVNDDDFIYMIVEDGRRGGSAKTISRYIIDLLVESMQQESISDEFTKAHNELQTKLTLLDKTHLTPDQLENREVSNYYNEHNIIDELMKTSLDQEDWWDKKHNPIRFVKQLGESFDKSKSVLHELYTMEQHYTNPDYSVDIKTLENHYLCESELERPGIDIINNHSDQAKSFMEKFLKATDECIELVKNLPDSNLGLKSASYLCLVDGKFYVYPPNSRFARWSHVKALMDKEKWPFPNWRKKVFVANQSYVSADIIGKLKVKVEPLITDYNEKIKSYVSKFNLSHGERLNKCIHSILGACIISDIPSILSGNSYLLDRKADNIMIQIEQEGVNLGDYVKFDISSTCSLNICNVIERLEGQFEACYAYPVDMGHSKFFTPEEFTKICDMIAEINKEEKQKELQQIREQIESYRSDIELKRYEREKQLIATKLQKSKEDLVYLEDEIRILLEKIKELKKNYKIKRGEQDEITGSTIKSYFFNTFIDKIFIGMYSDIEFNCVDKFVTQLGGNSIFLTPSLNCLSQKLLYACFESINKVELIKFREYKEGPVEQNDVSISFDGWEKIRQRCNCNIDQHIFPMIQYGYIQTPNDAIKFAINQLQENNEISSTSKCIQEFSMI